MKLSQNEKTRILNLVNSQPPIEWLINNCDTPDRREHWVDLRLKSYFLGLALEAEFEGDPTLLEKIDPEVRHSTELEKDAYLALRAVVFEVWKPSYERWVRELRKPGDAEPETAEVQFLIILKMEADHLFFTAFPEFDPFNGNYYREFSATKAYGRKALLKRLERGQFKNPYSKKRYQKELQRTINDNWGPILRDLYVRAARDSQPKEGSPMQQALDRYDKCFVKKSKYARAQFHPRKSPKGWAWSHGKRLTANSKGGVYSS